MAKARATCTCSHCGATFEKKTTKMNRREAESWKQWAEEYYDICPDCEIELRKAAAAETAARAKATGLPDLIGSEKQVLWALSIREEKMNEMNQFLENVKFPPEEIEIANICNDLVSQREKASWWIDNRASRPIDLLRSMYQAAREQMAENVPEAKAARKEATMIPEEVTHVTVSVVVKEASVSAKTPKDESFRQLVEDLGFYWDTESRVWVKQITPYTDTAEERAAELINLLLREGFPVECFDVEARKRAIHADFSPECHRWIKCVASGEYTGMLRIEIPRGDQENLYDTARDISPKTIYHKGAVLVPINLGDLVEDFASMHGYQWSNGAKAAVTEYRNATRVTVAKPE